MQPDDYWACAGNYTKPCLPLDQLHMSACSYLATDMVSPPCVHQLDTDKPVERPKTGSENAKAFKNLTISPQCAGRSIYHCKHGSSSSGLTYRRHLKEEGRRCLCVVIGLSRRLQAQFTHSCEAKSHREKRADDWAARAPQYDSKWAANGFNSVRSSRSDFVREKRDEDYGIKKHQSIATLTATWLFSQFIVLGAGTGRVLQTFCAAAEPPRRARALLPAAQGRWWS